MTNKSYKALRVFQSEKDFITKVVTRNTSNLPDGDVLICVHYSSLNYKDALSAAGKPGVTKNYPHTPGIDAAGVVAESKSDDFEEGDEVICTSYDLGMNTDGGFGEYIRVPADWVLPLPKNLTLKESMQLGTAGLTAGIGVYKLHQSHLNSENGPVLVTGATGGVGSLAVAMLAKSGFKVIAATGKLDQTDYLKTLGASEVIDRDQVRDDSGRPLLSSRWAGAIETVGGPILDTVIRSAQHNGVITCCGNVVTHELNTNVYPFILRGVHLLGIDSGICKMPFRKTIWQKLADEYKPNMLNEIAKPVELNDLQAEIKKMLEGGQVGRKFVVMK